MWWRPWPRVSSSTKRPSPRTGSLTRTSSTFWTASTRAGFLFACSSTSTVSSSLVLVRRHCHFLYDVHMIVRMQLVQLETYFTVNVWKHSVWSFTFPRARLHIKITLSYRLFDIIMLTVLSVTCSTPTGKNKSLPRNNPSKHVALQTLLSHPLQISVWDVIAGRCGSS